MKRHVLAVEDDLWHRVKGFKHSEGLDNLNEAVVALLERGLGGKRLRRRGLH
jgi:hypothetical protein